MKTELINNIEFWYTGGLVMDTKITTSLSWHADVRYGDDTSERFSGDIPLKHENNTNAWNTIALSELMLIFRDRSFKEAEIELKKEPVRRFNTGDHIKHEKSYWQCIVSDERTACFGLTSKYGKDDPGKTSYVNTFLVSQFGDDNFEYELTKQA